MLLIDSQSVETLLPMRSAIDCCLHALKLHSEGKARVPLRTNIDIPEVPGQALFMPASVPDIEGLGIKIVGVFPDNSQRDLPVVPAQVIMMNGRTGLMEALIDGTALTKVRTGAVQGAATELLARKDARIGALIGTGGQAASQLEAMLTVRELTEVRVCDLNVERARAFADAQQKRFKDSGCCIKAARTADEAIDGADVITAVTISRDAVFDGDRVAPGCHVNGIGSYTPEMAELPERLMARAERIAVDTQDALAEAGDLIGPIERGTIRAEDCIDLGLIARGVQPGRSHSEHITVFDSVGSAVLDIVCASQVVKAAREQGLGVSVDF
ncbi:hypothetical protein [Devriesea agamarum]|uniref:hypothetical protein n=1 Tax=Devriesea agamarum TaxID=472569 RepID=UPI00071DB693|nr:hypothetical protein [Devriesea agamarum]